jgi:hypothetical protein
MVKQLIPWFALGHAVYNAALMALLFRHGWIGWSIRTSRLTGAPVPLESVRRHRMRGPVLTLFGGAGFFIGLGIVLLDKGRPAEYPLHFAGGLALLALLISARLTSNRIKGPEPRPRNVHAAIGAAVLVFYVMQSILGLGILL